MVIGTLTGALTQPCLDLGLEPGNAGTSHTDATREAPGVFPSKQCGWAYSDSETSEVRSVQQNAFQVVTRSECFCECFVCHLFPFPTMENDSGTIEKSSHFNWMNETALLFGVWFNHDARIGQRLLVSACLASLRCAWTPQILDNGLQPMALQLCV